VPKPADDLANTAGPRYASWPRRIIALFVDWILATLITVGIIGPGSYAHDPNSSWVVMLVFFVEVTVLTAFAGASFGQLLLGIRVLTLDGRPLNLLVAMARTILVCLVIPPLIFRSDSGRGLHDLAAGSAAFVR
jgi:uncharacterized RDD family membrane protein YckC